MTTTTESSAEAQTATTVPSSLLAGTRWEQTEAWTESLASSEMSTWTHLHSDIATLMARLVREGHTTVPPMAEFMVQFRAAVPAYNTGQGADNTVYTWVLSTVQQALAEQEEGEPLTDEQWAERWTAQALLETLAPTEPTDWLALGASPSTPLPQSDVDKIREVLLYQFENWMQGKRVPADWSPTRARGQFERRLDRIGGDTRYTHVWSQRVDMLLQAGITAISKKGAWVPRQAPYSSVDLYRWAQAEYPEVGSTIAGYRVERVAQWAWAQAAYGAWSKGGPHQQAVIRFTAEQAVMNRVENSFDNPEDYRGVIQGMVGMVFPAFESAATQEVDESGLAKDGDEFLAWQMSLHPTCSEFQAEAIKDGVADTVDAIVQGEITKDTDLTAYLRRSVIQYGFMRYTGKDMRRVLEANLRSLVDNIGGKGLTTEQWAERWVRRNKAVSYVSGRYGEQQSLCSVLEKATSELGIDPLRKPKHKVRFEGSGVEIEVEVQTWYDDDSVLISQARAAWEMMSAAERQAAIIRHTEPYVQWSDMKSVRP